MWEVKENPKWLGRGAVVVALAWGGALSLLLLLDEAWLPTPLPPDAPAHVFSGARAYAHLRDLALPGPRVAGSEEVERGKNVVLQALNRAAEQTTKAHAVETGDFKNSNAFTLSFLDGMSSAYRDTGGVWARIRPANTSSTDPQEDAILFNCHVDTVAGSPGASDDAAGCAVLLETFRALLTSAHSYQRNLVFLFNDAEENIMQASHAFVTGHPYARGLRAFVNVEACGADGRELLFQAGPREPRLLRAYAAHVPRPYASSLAQEVFQSGLFPGDTDFRIFRDFANLSGVDLAWSSNGYVYHTGLDRASAVSAAALQRAGDNVLALAAALAGPAHEHEHKHEREHEHDEQPVYFDVAGRYVVVLAPHWGAAFAVLSVGLSVLVTQLHARARAGAGHWRRVQCACRRLARATLEALLVPALLAALITFLNPMRWFRWPELLVLMYGAPAVAIACARAVPLSGVATRGWACAEAAADAAALAWACAALAAAAARLRSGFVPALWALLPSAAELARLLLPGSEDAGWRRLAVYLLGQTLPFVVTFHLELGFLRMLVPVTGRIGAQPFTEVLMCVCCSVLALCNWGWLLPLWAASSPAPPQPTAHPSRRLLGLPWEAAWVAGAVALALSPWPAQYAADAPQRHMLFHQLREQHHANGTKEIVHGYWMPDMDINAQSRLNKLVPAARAAQTLDGGHPWCAAWPWCGAPYHLPAVTLVGRSRWLPLQPPQQPPPGPRTQLTIRHEGLAPAATRIHFHIAGPGYIVVILSVCDGALASSWSLLPGAGPPQRGPRQAGKDTYFLLLHQPDKHTHRPWKFHIDLEHTTNWSPKDCVRASVSGHYLSLAPSRPAPPLQFLPSYSSVALTHWHVHTHLVSL